MKKHEKYEGFLKIIKIKIHFRKLENANNNPKIK